MPSILQRYATPLTIGLFLVSLISGVALFFHAAPGVFHSMHEWLSMLLIAPVALHLWRNWRPMMSYLARPAFAISMSVCLVAAMGFALASTVVGGRHGSAQFAILEALTATTPEKLAPALGTDAEHLVDDVEAARIRQGGRRRHADGTCRRLGQRRRRSRVGDCRRRRSIARNSSEERRVAKLVIVDV